MVSTKAIDAILPQTQCGECSYAGCRPYAEAIAAGRATINRCPPGGVAVVQSLAKLLAIDANPYLEEARANTRPPALAVIREEECIGCTKCIQACPVDAIIGSAKSMHSIINQECTGCGLCVEPCPVDCIELHPLTEPTFDKTLAKEHFNARNQRLEQEKEEKQQLYREKRQLVEKNNDLQRDLAAKQDFIQQALARVKAKKL